MDEAFLALLEQKDFAYITVKELCQKAGVNRSTFYLHYETVGDLLAESVEYMHRQFMAQFSNLADVAGKLPLSSGGAGTVNTGLSPPLSDLYPPAPPTLSNSA